MPPECIEPWERQIELYAWFGNACLFACSLSLGYKLDVTFATCHSLIWMFCGYQSRGVDCLLLTSLKWKASIACSLSQWLAVLFAAMLWACVSWSTHAGFDSNYVKKKTWYQFLLAFKYASERAAHLAIYGFVNQQWNAWFMKDKQFNHFVFSVWYLDGEVSGMSNLASIFTQVCQCEDLMLSLHWHQNIW